MNFPLTANLFFPPPTADTSTSLPPTPPILGPSPYPSLHRQAQPVYGTLVLLRLLRGVSIPLEAETLAPSPRPFHKAGNIKAVGGNHGSPCLPFIDATRYTDTCSGLFCAWFDCHLLAFGDGSPGTRVRLLPTSARAHLHGPPRK